MRSDWYKNAVIYQIDTPFFLDGNGDGCGDLQGIRRRLDYIRGLGATGVWLTPFYLTPFLDGGYDVQDHLQIDPRFGDIADMVLLLEEAEELGIHVIIELVLQHTSDQHVWFQSARQDKHSPYRDYYIWADEPPEEDDEPMFPGVEESVWSWDEAAQQYYRHMFYRHEPDLNLRCPQVIKEIERIIVFWLRLGVSGFRLDAASHMVKQAGGGDADKGYWLLNHLRDFVMLRRPETILLGEVDVAVDEYADYFGDNDRLHMLLSFNINKHFFLALARQDATPLADALRELPAPPLRACFANWLRNHDELDLDGLSDEEKEEVMAAFAPDEEMRVYQRGIRRRLAPMLQGDTAWIAMAHAVLFSLPGTPVMRYGDEIGMGDDLRLPERQAVRTPMQWSGTHAAGFSTADVDRLLVSPIDSGPFRYQKINVGAGQLQANSLLRRVSDMARTRLGLKEIGSGNYQVLDTGNPAVLGLFYQADGESLLMLVNFCRQSVTANLHAFRDVELTECLADRAYSATDCTRHPRDIELAGYGYRWFGVVKTRDLSDDA
ncbi:alpha-amylase family protein [Kosakonia oryzae]|uniref:alpha-amylase family protein n=1 Tax=Kosakonia oryzae TaxID=497725 RepID=UPI001D06F173|nr:alpha-amylase family protein [Kosakonia oryzae]UDJ80384.1 alpha-amylase family protein [Kosakonia oryzae]